MDAMKSWTPLAPRTALPLDRPLVFLESTVIAQGLPWPENLETALAMEAAVQASGAVPAMIAVVDGVVRLGLSAAEIEAVARSAETPATTESTGAADHHEAPPRPFSKANRRDLSAVLAQQGCAATTVSATLWLAQRLGKKPCIMTTGGLGGVHRAATETFDISSLFLPYFTPLFTYVHIAFSVVYRLCAFVSEAGRISRKAQPRTVSDDLMAVRPRFAYISRHSLFMVDPPRCSCYAPAWE